MKLVRGTGGGIAGHKGAVVYAFREFFGQNLTESGINPAVARAEILRQKPRLLATEVQGFAEVVSVRGKSK